VMGAGSICLQRPTCNLVVRVGREEEGVSSLRPELAAMARTLQAAPAESDLLYLCDSEAALNKISRWIGSGPRTTLDGDANADIMVSIIECVCERVQKGDRTFMVKVKAHHCEPLDELADTQAENARQLEDECRQWTVRTPSMTYEWSDNNGVKQTTAWSLYFVEYISQNSSHPQDPKSEGRKRSGKQWNEGELNTKCRQ